MASSGLNDSKITDYFPPSPSQDDSKSGETQKIEGMRSQIQICKGKVEMVACKRISTGVNYVILDNNT